MLTFPTYSYRQCCGAGKTGSAHASSPSICPCIYVSVAPPRTAANATHVALEHILAGADNLNDGYPFADYAASLIGARLWSFWWD
jgi:hypothetical protein